MKLFSLATFFFSLLLSEMDSQYLRESAVVQDNVQAGELHSQAKGRQLLEMPTIRVIVKYKTEAGRTTALDLSTFVYHDFVNDTSVVIELDPSSILELENLRGDIVSVEGDDLWVEQGYLVEHLDPKVRKLNQETPWGIDMVEAPSVPIGAYKALVCVIDTGAAKKHPDLPKALMSGVNRFSKIDNKKLRWLQDMRGHGTHVAGTISARDWNGIGVRGIGRIPLFITRGLDDEGNARESDILEAIEQCEQSGARIITLSLGGNSLSTMFMDKLTYLYDEKGILIFAAAGNDGQATAKYPAAHPRVVSVAAVNEDGSHWSSSNTGDTIELSAPGNLILSTSVNGAGAFVYSYYSGTSMATPHAAGVAALLWSHFPHCSNGQIRYAMAKTAQAVGSGCDTITGYGIVKAKQAYDFLAANSCIGASWGSNNQGGCSIV
jgi:serine protease